MPLQGDPCDPTDSDGERSFVTWMPASALPIDLSGGVQLAQREGVFAQSSKCRACTLYFVLFSWARSRHTPGTIVCPECGIRGGFLHYTTQLSDSTGFLMDSARQPEIYDVWPFRWEQT